MTLYKMVLKLDPLCVCVCAHPEPKKRQPGVWFEKTLFGGEERSVCWLQESGWEWEVGVGAP